MSENLSEDLALLSEIIFIVGTSPIVCDVGSSVPAFSAAVLDQQAVFSDFKHPLAVNSSVGLQEFKQCLSRQLQRNIIVMAKLKYPCRLELNCFFFVQSSACLLLLQRHPASKLSECTNARLTLFSMGYFKTIRYRGGPPCNFAVS